MSYYYYFPLCVVMKIWVSPKISLEYFPMELCPKLRTYKNFDCVVNKARRHVVDGRVC